MNHLLHKLGYTYKKPKLVPGKGDKEKQEAFLTYYERFMGNKPEDEAVYFMDGVHPEHNTLLVFLPPYSPHLNLIERLWKLFKKKVLYNRYYEKFKDFKKACQDFFVNISQYNKEIQDLMNEEFHMI